MKNVTFCLLIYFIFFSCQNNQETPIHTIKSFPINQELVHELVELDTMPGCPDELLLVGQYLLLVNDGDCNDQYFYVYDKYSFQLLGAFGINGKGPNELLYPKPNFQTIHNKSLTGFWIYNFKDKKHELVNIEKSLKNKQYVAENTYTIAETERNGTAYFVDGENMIVNPFSKDKGRFYTHNTKTDSMKWGDFYPALKYYNASGFSEPLAEVFVGRNALSKDGEFFVSALLYAKRIDIFNNQLDHQVSIKYEDSPDNIKLPVTEADWHNIYGYFAPFNIFLDKNNLIYAVMQELSLSGRTKDNKAEVHVISIQGEAKARYILDTHQWVRHFSLDEERNILFCFVLDDEGYPQIVSYHLPQEL